MWMMQVGDGCSDLTHDSRHDSVVNNRLRIGHCHLAYSYLLSGDDLPTYGSCGLPPMVKHILVECSSLRNICEKYFMVCFVDNHTVINFFKESHFLANFLMFDISILC